MNDETTRWASGSSAPDGSGGSHPTARMSSGAASGPARSRRPWLVPLLLVGVAILSFVVVSAVIRSGSEPATPASSDAPASPGTATSAPSAFPAEAVSTCLQGGKEVANTSAQTVRMKKDAATSCAFLDAVRSEVLAHRSSEPAMSSFSVKPYSVAQKEYVTMVCSNQGAFTYCEGGRSAKVWVRNAA